MQRFLNNWATTLASPLASAGLTMLVDAAAAAKLVGLGTGDFYLLTLISVDGAGAETAWEIVSATANLDGSLTIARAQEGTVAAEWPIGTRVEARYTAGAAQALGAHEGAADPHPQYATAAEAASAAPVQSVNSRAGTVTVAEVPEGGTVGQVLQRDAVGAAVWADPAAGGGGLTLLAESEVAGTRRKVMLAPLGTDNCDVILAPRAGSLQAHSAGNQRGSGAVDLQHNQSPTTAVASGTTSAIGGGSGNTASGLSSTVSGGSNGNASASYTTIAGGRNGVASSQYATVGGGWGNTANTEEGPAVFAGYSNNASALYSFIGAGISNIASNDYASVVGGRTNTASGMYGAVGGGYNNVAAGQYGAVSGGYNNKANASGSTVGGGNGNVVDGQNGTVAGGTGNKASATASTVAGGTTCWASGYVAAVGGGDRNTADGAYSFIPGGMLATARGCHGSSAHSAGGFLSAAGSAQVRNILLRAYTFDANPKVLTANELGADTSNTVALPDRSTYLVKGRVVAHAAGAANSSSWEFQTLIKRGTGAASTALVGTADVTMLKQSAGAAAWVLAVGVDTTIGGMSVTVTGAAATDIFWLAHIETIEAVN